MLEDHQVDEQILPIGYLLSGRYVLETFLGSGGMGAVYLANDRLLEDKRVAIKVLHKEFSRDSELTRRFLREVNMMHSVNHPNVVRTYDAGVQDGLFYFSMEYIEGLLLDKYLESVGRDYTVLGKITAQICKGLEAIHSQNIVHRDLKPGNILVSNDGVVKITDFGVARPVSSGHTAHREIMGSLDYIPPEVFQGHQISPASDFYSLGVILYGIVCGVFPFDAEDPMAIVWKHVNEVPVLPSTINPEIPSWMDRLIMRLLEKDPAKRPQSAREIIRFVRSNVHRDGKVLDSGSHDVSSESERRAFDTDIFEMEIDPSELEEIDASFSSASAMDPLRSDSFTSACNQVIFDALPTVDQIRKHEEMWEERKRMRDEGHDLKGLAAKVKQAEKYEEMKKIRLMIQIVGLVVIFCVVVALTANMTNGNPAEENDENTKGAVSINDLRKDYLAGKANIARPNASKPEGTLSKLKNTTWKMSDFYNKDPQVITERMQDLSFSRLDALKESVKHLQGNAPEPRQSPQLWSNGESTTTYGASTSMQALQQRTLADRQELQSAISSQPAIANVYSGYQSTTAPAVDLASDLREPTAEQKEMYIEKKRLRENLNSIQGELSAYSITDDSELAQKEAEAEAEVENIKKLKTTVESHLSTQLEKQKTLSSLVGDLDKGGYVKVAKELAKLDKTVEDRLASFEKTEQAYNEMVDSIKEGKLAVDKIAMAEVSKELERQRDELNKTLKQSINNGINTSFKELLDGGVLSDLADEHKASINIINEARRSNWKNLKAGQAQDKNTLESKKQEIEKRLSEIDKSLPATEENSIRGLVAVESFGANAK